MNNARRRFPMLCGVALLLCSTLLQAQPRGYALSLDGNGDYVRVPDHPSLGVTNQFTIAAWIYIRNYVEWASIVTKGGNDDGTFDLGPNNYTIHQSGPAGGSSFGRLRFTSDAPGLPFPFPESNTTIPLNEWHHVTITFDGSTIRFYLDGNPDGSHALSGPLQPNNDPLNIGADFPGGDEYWDGFMDELRIYNRALSQQHIRALTAGHSSPMASALVGYWTFDEGSGTIAHDRSRYGNNGDLIGDATWSSPGAPLHLRMTAGPADAQAPIGRSTSLSAYPNPFNPSTTIRYELSEPAVVTLEIIDQLGRNVATLVRGEFQSAGERTLLFDARDLPSGMYFYRLRAGALIQTKKILLLR